VQAYIFQSALWCAPCIAEIKRTRAKPAHVDEANEHTYDSGEWPKGPYPNGGGEADTPQHCEGCGVFLENPLTPDGDAYVREAAAEFAGRDLSWEEIAQRAEAGGKPVLADWIRFYFAPGQ
jgi:hypothetical protein